MVKGNKFKAGYEDKRKNGVVKPAFQGGSKKSLSAAEVVRVDGGDALKQSKKRKISNSKAATKVKWSDGLSDKRTAVAHVEAREESGCLAGPSGRLLTEDIKQAGWHKAPGGSAVAPDRTGAPQPAVQNKQGVQNQNTSVGFKQGPHAGFGLNRDASQKPPPSMGDLQSGLSSQHYSHKKSKNKFKPAGRGPGYQAARITTGPPEGTKKSGQPFKRARVGETASVGQTSQHPSSAATHQNRSFQKRPLHDRQGRPAQKGPRTGGPAQAERPLEPAERRGVQPDGTAWAAGANGHAGTAKGVGSGAKGSKLKGEKGSGSASRVERDGALPGLAKSHVITETRPPSGGATVNANWAALKATVGVTGRKRRRTDKDTHVEVLRRPEPLSGIAGVTPVMAIDCEMVGVGLDGSRSTLARVCVVNNAGVVLMDKFVAQKERVTDFRTVVSGVRPRDLAGAPSLEQVQEEVAQLIRGRILVGHAIQNDLKALLLSHPRKLIRDTARFPPLMRATAAGRKPKPRALRHLAKEELGLSIQCGEHSPVDDARAALYLYHKWRKEWEVHVKAGTLSQLKAPVRYGNQAHRGKSLAELAARDPMVDL
eukprot:jgi/Botrbrau1/14036/Bobra.0011s0002.1